MEEMTMDLKVIEKADMHRQILEYSFETTIIHSDYEILYINQSGADFLKSTKEEIIGTNIIHIFTEKYRDFMINRFRDVSKDEQIGELVETTIYKSDGSTVDVELYCYPIIFNEKKAIQSIVRDITSRRDVENELKKIMNEVATTIVPVADGIAVFPLVGSVDKDRANQLIAILPQKIQNQNVHHIIIDISGIYNIDESVVEFLYNLNAIMNIMGVTSVFTGVRPELAYKAISVVRDMTSLKTMSTVQEALKQINHE